MPHLRHFLSMSKCLGLSHRTSLRVDTLYVRFMKTYKFESQLLDMGKVMCYKNRFIDITRMLFVGLIIIIIFNN